MFFDVGDIEWCESSIPLLFYGLGLSYRCFFCPSLVVMRLIRTLFLHVCSETGPPREVKCRDSHQLFAVKDGGITLSAFFKVLL